MRHELSKIKAIRLLTDSENLIHILVSHLADDSVPDDLYIPSSAEGHIEEYLSENYKGIMFLRKLSKPSYRNRVLTYTLVPAL